MNNKNLNDIDIEDLRLSVRSYNSLKSSGINTVYDLMKVEDHELLNIKNLGNKSVKEILELKNIIANGEIPYKNLNNNLSFIKSNSTILEFIKEPDRDVKYIFFNSNTKRCIYNLEIDNLDLSVRSTNALKRASFNDVISLLNIDIKTFNSIKNLGEKSKREILVKLKTITNIVYQDLYNESLGDLREIFLKVLNDYKDSSLTYNENILKIKLLKGIKEEIKFSNNIDLEKIDIKSKYLNNDYNFFKDLFKKNILDFMYKINKNLSLEEIKFLFPNHLRGNNIIDKSIDELVEENIIEKVDNLYKIYYQSLNKFINNMDDERIKEVLINRLKGKTLLEIGNVLGITRERVRQLEKRAIDKIDRVREDDYKDIFEKFNLSEEEFKFIFNSSKEVYNYLNIKYKKGTLDSEDILKDSNIPIKIRIRAEKFLYRDYIDVGNIKIKKDRQEILDYILKTYCKDEINVHELLEVYDMFLEDYGLSDDESLKYTIRYFESTLAISKKVLWKFKKKLRYYDLSMFTKDDILDSLNLRELENIEYSTLKFFNDNIDIMNQWDIRDEYELHNLMKKVLEINNSLGIKFLRMPNVSFGKPDRDMQVLELLIQLSPISNLNLAKAYENEYGVKAETALANYFKEIDEYCHNSIYSIDCEQLDSFEFDELKDILTGEIYAIKDIKDIYKKSFNKKDTNIINTYNLKRLGFKVTPRFVYKENYQSIDECVKSLILNNTIFKNNSLSSNITNSAIYYNIIQTLKKNFDIIEFEPSVFVNVKNLEARGISKSKFREFIDYIDDMVDDEIFTIKYLRKKGMEHSLEELGFQDYFLSSILASDSKFKFRKVDGNILLRKGDIQVVFNDLIEQIVYENRKIDIYDLIDILKYQYGVKSEKYKILEAAKEKNLYYDAIMEKVYIDYDEYFEEV